MTVPEAVAVDSFILRPLKGHLPALKSFRLDVLCVL